MKITLDEKEITIREFCSKDRKKAKEFQDFVNSLIEEKAQILLNKKVSLKAEKEFLEENYRKIKKRKRVSMFAEHNNKIVGRTDINIGEGRENHVGNFGIAVRNGYRRIGLGGYLTDSIIKLAKKELKPKIIKLGALPTNKPAIRFYKKHGFKKVAVIPKQLQYKGKLCDEIIMILEL